MEYFVGVDPGQKGGIAILAKDGNHLPGLVRWLKMPAVPKRPDPFSLMKKGDACAGAIRCWLHKYLPHHFFNQHHLAIEQVNGIRGQGASSSFNFGRDCGILAQGLHDTFLWDTARQFHKMRWGPNVGLTIGATKKQSVEKALEYWPYANDVGEGKFTDGPAEAALIALYASKHDELMKGK